MSKYIFIISLLWVCFVGGVAAQTDTTDSKPKASTMHVGHLLRIGYDISRPITHAFVKTQNSNELQVDCYWRKESYLVAEGGWGSFDYNYSNLSYSGNNSFFRFGFDKAILVRLKANDWDMAFIGLRYGVGFVDRGTATYTTHDTLWGYTTGTIPEKSTIIQWFEITGGVKVELFKNIFAGWNIRGKFLITQSAFTQLPPSFIAGYGKGDKNSIFDFNFFLSYAIRWGMPAITEPQK